MRVPMRAAVSLDAQEVTYPLGVEAQEVTYPLGVSVEVEPNISGAILFLGASPNASPTSAEIDAMNQGRAWPSELVIREESYIHVGVPHTWSRPVITNLDTGQTLMLDFDSSMKKPLWPQDSTDYYFYRTWNKYPAGTYRLKIETGRRS